jgi:hypothetical protein
MLGTKTSWLSPGVARPVAPSGMLDSLEFPNASPGVVGLDVVADEVDVVWEVHPDDDASTPPPSNALLEPVAEHVTIGLIPGTLSSVAPSGIVLESADMLEDVEPSGDVAPIAEVGAL